MGRLGQVDEIAGFAVLLLSDCSGVVVIGSVIDWDQYVPEAHDYAEPHGSSTVAASAPP
jgi:hypothetical protein